MAAKAPAATAPAAPAAAPVRAVVEHVEAPAGTVLVVRLATESPTRRSGNSINIPPTIHVDQGTRIMVFVRRDVDFSSLYPDPVRQALREIRHERALRPAAAGSRILK